MAVSLGPADVPGGTRYHHAPEPRTPRSP